VDAALQPQGFPAASQQARETILRALDTHGGYLPLHDKSDPEEIRRTLQMSKKLFKNTIGNLYKAGLITIEEKGIRRRS
jgi:predicted RNA-binding protein (virulence factor B family)